VGYGDAHLDSMFVSNKTGIQNAGFQFALLYHYLRQDQDALTQAKQFCSWIGTGQLKPWMRPALDLEEGSGNQSSRANTWFNYVDDFFGYDTQPLPCRSWLYTGQSFGNSNGLAGICNSPRHTWIASYTASAPSLPHTLWQSTDGVSGSYITSWSGCGKVDTSIYSGSLAQLVASITSSKADNDMAPSVAYYQADTYYARIDPGGNDIQYLAPYANGIWKSIASSNASAGVSLAISSTGEKTITYVNTSGHTCRYIAAAGTDVWAWDDLDA
jgi:hypothetical protein